MRGLSELDGVSDVVAEVLAWIDHRFPHFDECREVDDAFGLEFGHGLVEGFRVLKVRVVESGAWVNGLSVAVEEGVIDCYFMAVVQKVLCGAASDISCAAGD